MITFYYNTNKQAQWTNIVFNCVFVLFCLFLTPCYAYSSIYTGNVIESISYDSNAPQMACTMTCPSDVTINCDESTHPSNTGTASSDCGTPTYTDNSTGSCPEVITRTWTVTSGNAGGNTCTPVQLANWDMNNCGSPYSDYSEFTANYPNSEQCLAISASNVYLNQGQHSCNVGYNGSGAAMCIAYPNQISSFSDNHPNAVRLDITFNPDLGSTASFTGFNFREVSSSIVNVLVGNSYFPADVNYPRQYGIRILKNGQEIFQQTGINTSTNWSLENFDFSNDPAFTVSTSTLFEIELLPYNFTTTSNLQNTWDVDQLEVYGCSMSCTPQVVTCTQTITVEDNTPCSLDSYTINNIVCDDNNTPDNHKDDLFTFVINVQGEGSNWSGGSASGAFNQNITMGPYEIYCGDLNFEIRACNGNALLNVNVIAPPACSTASSCDNLYAHIQKSNCCTTCPSGNIQINTAFNTTDINSPSDLVLSKPACASSRAFGIDSNARYAIDGNSSTAVLTAIEENPWWEIDLFGNFDITQIVLTGTNGGTYEVLTSDTPFSSYDMTTAMAQADLVQSTTGSIVLINNNARFVRIYRVGVGQLRLSNVSILGTSNASSSPYSYIWSVPSIGNSPNPNCLDVGTYQVQIVDNTTGCSVEKQITID